MAARSKTIATVTTDLTVLLPLTSPEAGDGQFQFTRSESERLIPRKVDGAIDDSKIDLDAIIAAEAVAHTEYESVTIAADLIHRFRTVRAAHATHHMKVAGLIVSDEKSKAKSGPVQFTTEEWLARWSPDPSNPLKKQTFTYWGLMGVALFDAGVDPDSDLFARVAFKGQPKGLSKAIRDAGKARKTDDIVEYFRKYDALELDWQKESKSLDSGSQGGGGEEGDNGAGRNQSGMNTPTAFEAAKAGAKAILDNWTAMSEAQREYIGAMLRGESPEEPASEVVEGEVESSE